MSSLPHIDPPLSDGQVVVRERTDRDAPALIRLLNDEEIARWTRVPFPYGADDERAHRELIQAHRASGEEAALAIASADDDELLGSIALRVLSWSDRRGGLGYLVARAAWGRGVAPRAVRLVCEWAFLALELERIEIHVDPRNARSQRVAEKAGFTSEGVLRSYTRIKGGDRLDMVCFSLLASELDAQPGTA